MESDDELVQPGIIVPQDSETSDSMNLMTHAVLDQVLYNVIHDIVLKAHREEKIARANTAAILIEQKAADSEPNSASASRSPRTPHRVETDAARYEDGEVYIRGNPLSNITEIRCSKCGLPKLLYPTDGLGARPPEDGVEYCKRHPYITKPDHDIYGLPFPVEDVKAPRKNAKSRISSSQSASQTLVENGSFDSPTPPPNASTNGRPSFPTTKCSRCSRYIAVRDYRKHLMACMGISSRSSGRAAVLKNNMNGLGVSSQNSSTPPASRKSTPALNTSFGDKKKTTSPTKREREDFEDDEEEEESEEESPKKKLKKKQIPKVKAKQEIIKKWKSGKVTLGDGKMVEKKLKKEPLKRAPSESSQDTF